MLYLMKKLIFTIFLVLGTVVFVQAQYDVVFDQVVFPDNKGGDLDYEKVKGSPYTVDTLQEAIIRGQEKKYLIRYDAFKGVIQFTEKGKEGNLKVMSVQNSYRFDFVHKDHSYITLIYPDSKKGFGLLVWSSGKGTELIKRQIITFEKGEKADGGYGAEVPDSFSNIEEKYFIRLQENGEVVEIPSKKKDIFALLGKDVEQRAKEEKLNPKKEEDLIKLLDWKYTK